MNKNEKLKGWAAAGAWPGGGCRGGDPGAAAAAGLWSAWRLP